MSEENFPSCEKYYETPEAIGLDGIDLEKVQKMDINKGKFHVYYNSDGEPIKSYTIKELNKFKSSSCNPQASGS